MQSQLLCVFGGMFECVMSLEFFFKFMAHSLTMPLRQNLLHKIALEYCGNKIVNDFIPVGKQF
jgi:hypothetical protein